MGKPCLGSAGLIGTVGRSGHAVIRLGACTPATALGAGCLASTIGPMAMVWEKINTSKKFFIFLFFN